MRTAVPAAAAATCAVCAGGLLLAAGPVSSAPAAALRDTVTVGNPVAGNNGFGVVTEEDAYLGSTESEGPVAVGGDLRFGAGYNVSLNTAGSFTAPGDTRPTALLVGGRVRYDQSDPAGVLKVLQNGYVKVGDMTGGQALNTDGNGAAVNTHLTATGAAYDSTPRIELTTRQPAASVGPANLMDFPGLFTTYRDRAQEMATCANNVVLRDGNGDPLADQTTIAPGSQIKLSLDTGRTNVLHLTGEMLNNISTLTLLNQPTAAAPLVIVVDTSAEGGDFTWHAPTMAGVGSSQTHILWDFPDATRITNPDGDQIEGTVYAPSAEFIDLDSSNIEGDVIVKSLIQGSTAAVGGNAVNAGEIHYRPFDGNVRCEDDSTPTPAPTGETPTPTNSPDGATETPTPTPTPTPTGDTSPTASPTPTGSTSTPTPTGSTSTPTPTSSAPISPSPTGPALAHTGSDGRTSAILGGIAVALVATGAGAVALGRLRRNGRHR
ncbi:choice-of-anchor A family protein [Streptomyces sp. SID8379]|uniref:choice-of-anchor A family protein n=1 Tax=unclassified Streptomyces TaxID=2593676 RepID=UPI00037395C1|nr:MULTISPECIES: choice-of-anchor A family protein [unclassified Streptomyces]MYW64867.1 choice-of-anchor A family protein [Streptomyces sp. SID8379]